MVQFFKGSHDPRDLAYGKLAEALGGGLGKGITSYQANKALDEVIGNKEFSNEPISAKMGKLESALRPYGDIGRQILQDRIGIEQQVAQEKEQAKQLKAQEMYKRQGSIVGKILNGQEITPEEQAELTPEQTLAIAKHKQAKQLADSKNTQATELANEKNKTAKEIAEIRAAGKAPLGGLKGQPIPEDQAKAIRKVIEENPDASPEQLELALNESKVNPAYFSDLLESRRRQSEIGAKNKRENEKIATEHDIKFHQESSEYEKEIERNARNAQKQLDVVEDVRKSVGKVKPLSLANVLPVFGRVGEKLGEALTSKDQQVIKSAVVDFLEGKKEIFGVRLSDADLKIVRDKLPGIEKSQEANKAILDIIEKYSKKSILKKEAAKNVLENKGIKTNQSGKLRPLGYESEVEREFERLSKGETSFESLPPADQYKGKKIKDTETGKTMISNGKSWEPA